MPPPLEGRGHNNQLSTHPLSSFWCARSSAACTKEYKCGSSIDGARRLWRVIVFTSWAFSVSVSRECWLAYQCLTVAQRNSFIWHYSLVLIRRNYVVVAAAWLLIIAAIVRQVADTETSHVILQTTHIQITGVVMRTWARLAPACLLLVGYKDKNYNQF